LKHFFALSVPFKPLKMRSLTVAAAQMGPNHLDTPREEILSRMISLLTSASEKGAKLVVYPELSFSNFFPRYLMEGAKLESFFEKEGPDGAITSSPGMKPLFDKARERSIDISVGYAEQVSEHERYNAAVYYSASADKIIAKYRKVHLPGAFEPFPEPGATQQLEKRYFKPGNLGFKAFRAPGLLPDTTKVSSPPPTKPGTGDPILGILICNDRRWPEAWRTYSLQGAELILCGYNTTGYAPQLLGDRKNMSPEEMEADVLFHNKLVLQANSYMNACWSVNVAKCGLEDGKYNLIGGSCVVDPEGHVVAEARTKGDEVVVAEIDLGACRQGKEKVSEQLPELG
jgi:predicted amidohydrolase